MLSYFYSMFCYNFYESHTILKNIIELSPIKIIYVRSFLQGKITYSFSWYGLKIYFSLCTLYIVLNCWYTFDKFSHKKPLQTSINNSKEHNRRNEFTCVIMLNAMYFTLQLPHYMQSYKPSCSSQKSKPFSVKHC